MSFLIPALLHHRPQRIRESRVGRPWRTLTTDGCQHNRVRWFVVERNGASENLCSNQRGSPDVNPECATDLNHDHREREDIRLLAECPPIGQDLRCDPPHTVPVLVWSAPYRIHVSGDHGQTTIRDQRMTGGVHKDVRLVGCQCASDKTIKNDRVPP